MLLKRAHPDHGGESGLFVWTRALYEHVAGVAIEPVVDEHPWRGRYAEAERLQAWREDREGFCELHRRLADGHEAAAAGLANLREDAGSS
jgi:hypothetical protein